MDVEAFADSLPFHGLGVRILRGPPILACVPTDLCLSTALDPTSITPPVADSAGGAAAREVAGFPDLCVMDMGWLAIEDSALIGSTREDEVDGLGDGEAAEEEGDGVGSVEVLALVASGLTTFDGCGWTRAIFFCCGGVMCGPDDDDDDDVVVVGGGGGSGVWEEGGGIGVGTDIGVAASNVDIG